MRVLTHGLVLGAFAFARSVLVSGFCFRTSRPGGRNSINSSIQRFSVLAQVGALCCSAFQFNCFRFWRRSGRFVARHFNSTVFGSGVSRGALLLGSGPRLHGSGGVASESFSTCRTPSSRGVLVAVRQRRSRGSATSFLVILLRPPLRASICVIGSGRDMTMFRRRPSSGFSGGRGACSSRGFSAGRLAFQSWSWESHPVGDPSPTFEPHAARDGPCFSFGTAGWA